MKLITSHLIIMLLFKMLIGLPSARCQHISFTPLVKNNSIIVSPGFPNDLEFGYLLIDSENTRSIGLESSDAAWFQVEAPAHYDITVYIDWETPSGFMQHLFDHEAVIPFKLNFAYANQGETNIVEAKNNANIVPDHFFSASFPVSRRQTGVPLPPPTPEFDGYIVPTETFWLFFFGEIGPVSHGNMVTTGTYVANLNVHISFTVHE